MKEKLLQNYTKFGDDARKNEVNGLCCVVGTNSVGIWLVRQAFNTYSSTGSTFFARLSRYPAPRAEAWLATGIQKGQHPWDSPLIGYRLTRQNNAGATEKVADQRHDARLRETRKPTYRWGSAKRDVTHPTADASIILAIACSEDVHA